MMTLFIAGCDPSAAGEGAGESDGGSGTDSDTDDGEGTGTVAGYALLQGQTDHAGIEVVINEQTGFQGHADSSGAFQIEHVPAGTYSLTAALAGYTKETSAPFLVETGETTTVPPLMLSPSTGDLEGRLLLDQANDHRGIAVRVKGTSLAAETDQLPVSKSVSTRLRPCTKATSKWRSRM